MKIKVTDYIASYLAENGINNIFTVTGGGAMHLNDSFGHSKKLHCTYHHHEQAAAMAAEAYARIDNQVGVVCVTTGPGATNAITGVVCAWMDSIPMLVISGQVRYSTSVYSSGLKLRTRGIQEFDVIESVKCMTKYAIVVKEPSMIAYCLEKATFLTKNGRPGPCWLDIPLDIQASIIDTDSVKHYRPHVKKQIIDKETIKLIVGKIKQSKRPVLFAGNGIRLSGAHKLFVKLVSLLNAPVVTGPASIDLISDDNDLYVGRMGITGTRAGNFAVQNCDLLISLGSRLSYNCIGYNYKEWARNAFKIVNDIDENELKKDTIIPDLALCCDVKLLIKELISYIRHPLDRKKEWSRRCLEWKKKYPVLLPKHVNDEKPNIYYFFNRLTSLLCDNECLLVSAGTSRVVGTQASIIKSNTRFITNPSTASMGYDLPPAIGLCIARNKKRVICCTGDGGFQMNIQELQTIVHNHLPIIVFVLNNNGYHSIRMTQKSYFKGPFVGVGPDSKDLSFPDLSKLIPAYGLPYYECCLTSKLDETITMALKDGGPCVCEIKLSPHQITEPKVTSVKLDDGSFASGTLENMSPFLPKDELAKIMNISNKK